VLFEVADAAEVTELHRWLLERRWPSITAVVPAARTVLVEVDPRDRSALAAVRRGVADFVPGETAAGAPSATTVEVPAVYDGEDLVWVAEHRGLSVEEVIRRHAAATYTAAFCGFSPGFAYLIGGDAALQVPRRERPRTRVPAGSLAIAGEFTAVYPAASPGGWRLIGRAVADVWRVDREPPALIAPGDRVRFVQRGDPA
jgi:KipI family sensor histidine kinase inhibitor